MNAVRLRISIGAILGVALFVSGCAVRGPDSDIEMAYSDLVSADRYQEIQEASERLGALGEDALPFLLKGIKHKDRRVRSYSHNILRSKFGENPKAIEAIIGGLKDEYSRISYSSAFYLGEHRIAEAKDTLKSYIDDTETEGKTRYAAAKSLAQLGEKDVMTMLYRGLGSEVHYTRYLSNMGIKALCGKDLTDFGYEGPFEGAPVFGFVAIMVQHPILGAKRKLGRWKAIVKFIEWLENEKPEFFRELYQETSGESELPFTS